MTHPILVCPVCGSKFDARSADASSIKKSSALPCNDCIRHVVERLRAFLAKST